MIVQNLGEMMAKKIFPIFFGISVTAFLLAPSRPQESVPTGLIFDDEAYNALPDTSITRDEKIATKIDLRKYAPPPGDQGDLAACVGYALSAAYSIQRAVRGTILDAERLNAIRHSASYIFNQIKQGRDCQTGAFLQDGLELMKSQGVCPYDLFKDSNENCDRLPGPREKQQAARFKIRDYRRLFSSGERPTIKMENIRTTLSKMQPAVVGLKIPYHFFKNENKPWQWKKRFNNDPSIGHAMVVVGFNKNEKTFELMNSFGPDWRDGGFVRVTEEAFMEMIHYGFVMPL